MKLDMALINFIINMNLTIHLIQIGSYIYVKRHLLGLSVMQKANDLGP